MALISTDLFGCTTDKVQRSIERIKAFEPPEGYFLGFSGGKDSVVIQRLADMAGVKYDAHYHITTVDPPELTRFIREKHPDVIFDRPRLSMRQLIIQKKVPPTRLGRYCCENLKEVNGTGRVVMTGTRWAESVNRKNNQGLVSIFSKNQGAQIALQEGAEFQLNAHGGIVMNMDNDSTRRTVELCYRTHKTLVNPIIDWTEDDIWEFIRAEKIPYCSLYDEGWKRLGCIGCPLARRENQIRGFKRWPVFYKMYLHAFADMLKARNAAGLETTWKTAEDVMRWWLLDSRKCTKAIDGQTQFDEFTSGGAHDD